MKKKIFAQNVDIFKFFSNFLIYVIIRSIIHSDNKYQDRLILFVVKNKEWSPWAWGGNRTHAFFLNSSMTLSLTLEVTKIYNY